MRQKKQVIAGQGGRLSGVADWSMANCEQHDCVSRVASRALSSQTRPRWPSPFPIPSLVSSNLLLTPAGAYMRSLRFAQPFGHLAIQQNTHAHGSITHLVLSSPLPSCLGPIPSHPAPAGPVTSTASHTHTSSLLLTHFSHAPHVFIVPTSPRPHVRSILATPGEARQ